MPEVRTATGWRQTDDGSLAIPDRFIRQYYVAPNGKVFLAGSPNFAYLDVTGTGQWESRWTNGRSSAGNLRSAVMYAPGRSST